jgi:thiamine-phosphate pyrophosphorylase
MAQDERPQIYLITPPEMSLQTFPDLLARVLDVEPVACLRLTLSSRDADHIARAGDALREVAHARDVAIVIESHVSMVERLGLDGIHLADGARSVRDLRKELGPDAIVGAFCGASRHDGMNAGEAGADYVSFGPLHDAGLGDKPVAELDLFGWWSEMIEVPIVAEGGLTTELIQQVSPVTDFIGLGQEIWTTDDPVQTFRKLADARG